MEFWGSKQTGSESLFADAWHMVSDNLGYGIGIMAATLALSGFFQQHENLQKHFEQAAALFVFGAGLYMLSGSVVSFFRGEPPLLTSNRLLVSVAFIGLMTNVFMYFLMRALRVEHRHGHSHHDGVLESNILHTIGDGASSAFVLVSAGLAWYFQAPWVGYFDLMVMAGIAFWLMIQAWKMLRASPHEGDGHSH